MRQFSHTFILIEGLSSVATGLFVVVAPALFARLLLGEDLSGGGLYFAQLYGAMIAAWGAVSVAYLRAGGDRYQPFARWTLVGTIPTNIVLTLMLIQGDIGGNGAH